MDRAAGAANRPRQRVAFGNPDLKSRRTALAAEVHRSMAEDPKRHPPAQLSPNALPIGRSTMTLRSLLPEAVENYVSAVITRETDLQRRLRTETATMRGAGMQIGADQGALLGLLVRLIGAKRALEIGTYTGYSALAVAMALPPDGKLFCCDINDDWTQVARRYWHEANLDDRIELRLAPAADTLRQLLRDP